MRVQVFTWEGRDGKERKFSVDAALALIRDLQLEPEYDISLECCREGLSRNYHVGELKKKHIAKADLTQPIIFVTLWDEAENGWRNILIDGWHRMMKMHLLGRTEPLKAYILSPEASEAIQIAEIVYPDETVWKAQA